MAFLAFDNSRGERIDPIVLDKAGRILDGRNRLAACKLAGVEPSFVTFDGDDPDGYALDVNIRRRHMKPGARHLVTEMARRRVNGAKSCKIATAAGINKSRLAEAAVVIDYSQKDDLARFVLRVTPTVAQSVIAGEKPLNAAYDEAKVMEAERQACGAIERRHD